MIRIGFDPMLEAQQRQQEILKAVQQYRIADEASLGAQSKAHGGYKLIALIGKQLAILGSNLTERYGAEAESGAVMSQTVDADGCR